MPNDNPPDAKNHEERLAAEQAVRNAIGKPIEIKRDAPQHEQTADGKVRSVQTNEGRYTVTRKGEVEKDGNISR